MTIKQRLFLSVAVVGVLAVAAGPSNAQTAAVAIDDDDVRYFSRFEGAF